MVVCSHIAGSIQGKAEGVWSGQTWCCSDAELWSVVTESSQRVKVGNNVSTLMPVKTGVLQGSVLGPLLDSPKFASQSVYPYLNEFYE